MTTKEALTVLQTCISETTVARVKFSYNDYYEMLFPISMSNELFLSVVDRDFILDGYTVRRISDISDIKDIRQTYLKLHALKGNLKKLSLPPLDITDLKSLFISLIRSKKYIIIEGKVNDLNVSYFAVGVPLAVTDKALKFRSFDGSGKWSDEAVNIPYYTIDSVTVGSSYVSTYAKYVKPYSENKNRQ